MRYMYIISLPIYVVLFCLLLVISRQFNFGVIFYEGVAISFLLFIINLKLISFFGKDGMMNLLHSLLVFFLLYSFNITIPALLDRSISYYIIGVTAIEGESNVAQYKTAFFNGFINNNGAIEKRLNEQVISGNIVCLDGACRLSDRGYMIYKANVFMASVLRLDTRYVKPENYK
jgi:hypothetical protein